MYEICTEANFSAAHHLQNYDGPCENIHGHNWLVKATVRCGKLNDIGIGIDFRDFKSALKDAIAELDHSNLNDVFKTADLNPSSENIACYVYKKLKSVLNDGFCNVAKVEVYETPGNSASYFEE